MFCLVLFCFAALFRELREGLKLPSGSWLEVQSGQFIIQAVTRVCVFYALSLTLAKRSSEWTVFRRIYGQDDR